MKVKSEENSVTLIPETEWEHDQLERLRVRAVKSKQFEDGWGDSWSSKGGLKFEFNNDWGR